MFQMLRLVTKFDMLSKIGPTEKQHAQIWIYNITTSNVMRDCYGYKFYLEHVFNSYTDFYKRQQRVHTRWNSSSINANIRWKCMYYIKHNIKLTTKNQKAISEMSGISFFVIIIANINLAYWMIYLICTLK